MQHSRFYEFVKSRDNNKEMELNELVSDERIKFSVSFESININFILHKIKLEFHLIAYQGSIHCSLGLRDYDNRRLLLNFEVLIEDIKNYIVERQNDDPKDLLIKLVEMLKFTLAKIFSTRLEAPPAIKRAEG